MATTYTKELNILRVDPDLQFADEAFNKSLDDLDLKVLGIMHLKTAMHWQEWVKNTNYVKGDVVRYPSLLGSQYAKCTVAGTSSSTEPKINVTGSRVTDGTVEWVIKEIGGTGDGSPINAWLGGTSYVRGDCVIYGSCLYRCKTDHTATTFDKDYSKWLEIDASIRMWSSATFYNVNDTVVYDNLIYKCVIANNDTTFTDTNWVLIGGAGGISTWATGKTYQLGQLVLNDGTLYRATSKHLSAKDFATDSKDWEFVTANIQVWETGKYYETGVLVSNSNVIYECVTTHTSTVFADDRADWKVYHTPNAYVRDWVASNYYEVGQIVIHSNKLYECITTNNDSTFADKNWKKLTSGGIEEWATNTAYAIGDVVIANNKIYKCITANTSTTDFATDSKDWQEISASITHIDDWVANKAYAIGDLVANDAKIYRCNTANTSSAKFETDIADWEELSPTINEITVWASGKGYVVGNIVINDNRLYRCTVAHTSSSLFATDIADWVELSSCNIAEWKASTYYKAGDLTLWDNRLWKCTADNTSSASFITDIDKWAEISKTLIPSWAVSTLYQVNDVIAYDNVLYRCKTAHTSGTAFDETKFDVLVTGHTNIPDWKQSYDYKQSDVVLFEGAVLRALSAHKSSTDFMADYVAGKWIRFDGSTIKYIVNTTANTTYNIPVIPYTDIFYSSPQVKKYVSAASVNDVVKALVNSDNYSYDSTYTEVV